MSRPARDGQARLQSQTWSLYKLGDLPGVAAVTYGVVDTGRHDPQGIRCCRRDIVDGTIARRPCADRRAYPRRKPRTWLSRDDLVIVLVGRIGDSALVGEDQAGWNAARSVGVVRFTEVGRAWGVNAWLRRWLKAPEALEWLNRHAPGSAHATLPVSALKKLPVLLPPLDRRRHLLHGIDLIEQRRHLNTQIAAHAIDLADAHFERSCLRHASPSRRPLAEVAAVISGVALSKTTPVRMPRSRGWPPRKC